MIKNSIFLVLLLSSFACSKKNYNYSSTEDSLLWEISGKDLKKPSYLFGTIHMIDKKDYFFPKPLENIFNSSELLVTEIKINEMFGANMFGMLDKLQMRGDTTLEDLLTAEQHETIKDSLESKMGPMVMMIMPMLDNMKPIFLQQMFSMDMGSLDLSGGGEKSNDKMGGIESYEMNLSEKAKENKMPNEGLETVEDQLNVFDKIPLKQQANMLYESIVNPSEEKDMLKDLVELYKAQKIEEMYNFMHQSSDGIMSFEEDFLIKRNKNWIPKINKFIHDKVSFIAVGAGHLPGENGVINLLKKEGYTLKPIKI